MDRRSFFGWAAGGIAALLGLWPKPKTQWIGIHKVMEEAAPLALDDHQLHVDAHAAALNGLFKAVYMKDLAEPVLRRPKIWLDAFPVRESEDSERECPTRDTTSI